MKLSFPQLGVGLCALTLLLTVVVSQTRLGECVSESLEGTHYILFFKNAALKRGDIVSIQGHPVKYVGEKLLAKRILGLPGDRIVRDHKGIRIETQLLESKTGKPQTKILEFKTLEFAALEPEPLESKTLEATPHKPKAFEFKTLALLKTTREGNPLTPISIQIVPESYVFVAGDNPHSFDSRYEEFGLVPYEKIWGKAIWVW